MSKIKIRAFGPIKEGLTEEEYLDIGKISLFLGNQATGKSSVAKLISTCTWVEKSLFRGQLKVNELEKPGHFVNKHCAYQGIKNYFRSETEVEFIGAYFRIHYTNGQLKAEAVSDGADYQPPKIMYVPAERNFLSVVERPEKIQDLPSPIYTFLDEFERAKTVLEGSLELPVNDVAYEFRREGRESFIKGEGFRLKLHEASSGIQSLLPLYLVSRNLAYSVAIERVDSNSGAHRMSLEQTQQLKEEIDKILNNPNLTEEVRSAALERLSMSYRNTCFVNIVEEIEQNLFPTSQRSLLNELLRFNNLTSCNQLLLTTHSPYILNYLTIAIKGGQLLHKAYEMGDIDSIRAKIAAIVPIESCIKPGEAIVYEFLEDGSIRRLPDFEGLPSDENYLNQFLFDTNQLFDELLEIEEALV